MTINTSLIRRYLQAADFRRLFNELGWDQYTAQLPLQLDGQRFTLQAVAEKRAVVALICTVSGALPAYATRRKIERQVAQRHREHLIIYVHSARSEQIWQWVRQEPGKPLASREHRYHNQQAGDSLIQKLQGLAFTLAEEEKLTLVDVTGRVRAAFDVAKITKKFYDQFTKERSAFQKFLSGVPDDELQRWYVSVMLNRLMFILFIQKKGFLNDDRDYLRTKLAESQARAADRYYRDFLCPLFFEGFAKPEAARPAPMQRLLGRVPYLNGGIFQRHQVEQAYGQAIQLPDAAFTRLFAFFDQYHWHLDDCPLADDQEINPGVLGFIFEKYINQKQMGAYYTEEDITDYIGKNTILPFLFDAAAKTYPAAFKAGGPVWSLLAADPDRYLHAAVRKGAELPLPPDIEAGVNDVHARADWNKPAADAYALPTELWRETVARRQRGVAVRATLASGTVHSINDLITYNLDIRQFAQDVIENCSEPALLRAFWHAIRTITVLDPTSGSGAFLFAGLNVLEPLYEACLARMEAFLDELTPAASTQKYRDLHDVLAAVAKHPNRRYFIYKSIIVNNLYGVDLMHEAVEIAKLRLFLKLVAQVERVEAIEPLPDIDFNIRAGNTLVGFATRDQMIDAVRGDKLLLLPEEEDALARIEEQAADVERLFDKFRAMQTAYDGRDFGDDYASTKQALQQRLGALGSELDGLLAHQYGINPAKLAYEPWRKTHQPFHWFVEFYGIIKQGGFDVILGNPPYVVLSASLGYTIFNFQTEKCNDLFAYVMEQSVRLLNAEGKFGMIIPVSSVSTEGFAVLRKFMFANTGTSWISNYAERPSKLFTGVEKRLSVWISDKVRNRTNQLLLSNYRRWLVVEREHLFATVKYVNIQKVDLLIASSLPKVSSDIELDIISKLNRLRPLESVINDSAQYKVYYTRQVRYFAQFFDFVPKITNSVGETIPPSELKHLSFSSRQIRDTAIAVLNSTLFYWFLSIYSDVRNLNRREILLFPCSLAQIQDDLSSLLSELACNLLEHFVKNSTEITNNYRAYGVLHIQSFQPRLSKALVDEIDRVLAQHYGFTEEELDFIINYDIKYRMGSALSDDDPGEGEDE